MTPVEDEAREKMAPCIELPSETEGKSLLANEYRNMGRPLVADAMAGSYRLSTVEKIAARALVRGRNADEAIDLLQTMANIIDGMIPAMKRSAVTESRAEQGKSMRKITHRLRLEAAEEAITHAQRLLDQRHG